MTVETPPPESSPLVERRRREVEALHTLLGLPAPVAPLWDDFAPELGRIAELSFSADLDSVGLMTRGIGQDFLARLARRLDGQLGHDAARPELELLTEVVHFSGRSSLFFKADSGARGLTEFSWYFTEGREPGATLELLATLGMPPDSRDAAAALFTDLDAKTVFLGRAIPTPSPTPGENKPARMAVYVPLQHLARGVLRARLLRILRRFVRDPGQRDLVLLHHDHLLRHEDSRLFVSIGLPSGPMPPDGPGLKLDYEGPLRSSMSRLFGALGVEATRQATATTLLDLLEAPHPGYLGLRLGGERLTCKIYVPRDPMVLW